MRVFDGMFDSASLWAAADVLVKAMLAAVLAAAVGWEREIKGHPAGIRTQMLVGLGVVFFTEVGRLLGSDPGRVASQVVTGIGFLGAGTILRMGMDVKGLTTAASIWATAAVAMVVCMGGAFLFLAVAAAGLVLITLALVDRLETRFIPRESRNGCLVKLESGESLPGLYSAIGEASGKLVSMEVSPSDTGISAKLTVRGNLPDVMRSISKVQGLKSAEWLP